MWGPSRRVRHVEIVLQVVDVVGWSVGLVSVAFLWNGNSASNRRTEPGFMGAAASNMIWIIFGGPWSRLSSSLHPSQRQSTLDHCTGPLLLTQRNTTHSRSCPKPLTCRKILNSISPPPSQIKHRKTSSLRQTSSRWTVPGTLSRVRSE